MCKLVIVDTSDVLPPPLRQPIFDPPKGIEMNGGYEEMVICLAVTSAYMTCSSFEWGGVYIYLIPCPDYPNASPLVVGRAFGTGCEYIPLGELADLLESGPTTYDA